MKAEIRTCPCACGGSISVPGDAEEKAIAEAVATHNRSVRHQVWRQRGDVPAKRDAYEDRLR